MLQTTHHDTRRGVLDTGAVFLAGFVISKNRTAREHEMRAWESMGGIITLFVVADRNAILFFFFCPGNWCFPTREQKIASVV